MDQIQNATTPLDTTHKNQEISARGTETDAAWALVETGDGGYALAGQTGPYGAGIYDVWLVKTDAESGLAWTDSTTNTLTLYRGATDPYWNFVRVRIWKPTAP